MYLQSLVALATCAACAIAASSASSSASRSSSSASAASQPVSSAAATSSVTYPRISAKTATSLAQNTVPSGIPQITTLTQAPNYSSGFPFSQFWSGGDAAQTSVEIQPKVINPINSALFAKNLTDPNTVPLFDYNDPAYFFPSTNQSLADPSAEVVLANANISLYSTPASRALALSAQSQLVNLINGSATDAASQCSTCQSALKIAQNLSRQAPWEVPTVLIALCNLYKYSTDPQSTCAELYAANTFGAVYSQILALANLDSGYDGQWICYSQLKRCTAPGVTSYYPTISELVTKPKPANASAPQTKSGTPRLKVVHLSDIHLDPRYALRSEANCTTDLCCRSTSINSKLHTTAANASIPAPRYGQFLCDAPYDLVTSVLQAIPQLTGISGSGPAFSVFTGDIVSHEPTNQIDSDYAFYEESAVYSLLKSYLTGNGSAPIYPTISNHDNRFGGGEQNVYRFYTAPTYAGYNAPNSLMPDYIKELYNADYDQLASLWQTFGWLDSEDAKNSRNHYAAFSVATPYKGLRIFSLNANVFYTGNANNYVNTSNADNYGLFKFMAEELQAAEDAGERVWVIMHEPAGFDGGASLPNPSDLYLQIINRYSPHVIAAVLGGHTHEDQTFIQYDKNGTDISATGALSTTWLVGSVTPLTNLNSGFRMYEVDSETFDIMESYNWYSDVESNTNATLSSGINWSFEYSARQAYGGNISWPSYAPLNATWWHHVTEQMALKPSLVETFQLYQSKLSARTPNCTSPICVDAKICYIRSGSRATSARCTPGYGSAQSS